MVQPYQPSVDTVGETAVLFIDGEPAHALRKRAVLRPDEVAPVRDDGVGAAEVMYDPGLVDPGGGDRRRARARRARWSPRSARRFDYLPLYARVDMIRDAGGTPVLLELEAIEPNFYLDQVPATTAAGRRRDRPPAGLSRGSAGRDRQLDRRRQPLRRRRVGVLGQRARPAASPARRRRPARARRRSPPGRRRAPPRRRPRRRPGRPRCPAASARIGRPAARYSNSLMLSSCERVGWAISSSASASRCSASARSRGRGCRRGRSGPGRRRSRTARASSSVSGPAITSSSFAAASGSVAGELARAPRPAARGSRP